MPSDSSAPPKGFRISADHLSVRGGMPVMETKNFGSISFEPDSELEFPGGLPGFDSRRRFVVVRFVESDPLIYLQSLEDPDLCFITMPILAVDPLYKLKVSLTDLDRLGLPPPRQMPVIAREMKLVCEENLRAAGATASDLSSLVARLRQ